MATRDAPVWHTQTTEEASDFSALLAAHRLRVRKLADSRLYLPTIEPYMEGLNTWCVNCPGSLFIIPVADVAQHFLASLCFRVQNGSAIYDDVHQERIPGLERFRHLIDTEHPVRLTLAEQGTLHECVTELSIACYAGMLMLQAIELGGGMFTGVNRSFTYLQAHHLALEFYDRYFVDGAYLQTHAQHIAQWHPDIQ